MLQKLPLGIQSFSEIRGNNLLYVDKTALIGKLISSGKYYFLSRPRRFGKSLLVNTIAEIFRGNKALFKGLQIEDSRDWETTHPVLLIPFSKLDYQGLGLEQAIVAWVYEQAEHFEIQIEGSTLKTLFNDLLKKVSKNGRVVLLVDEYDKPIIDHLGKNIEHAFENRAILKTFYSILKDSDDIIRFVLITGVSKFSRVSIFSELNNLTDLTMDPRFSTMLGYTQEELEHYFEPYFNRLETYTGLSKNTLLDEIREWYNGYSWDAKNFVYNPYSVLSLFEKSDFQNYWFETGTPTFLINLLKKEKLHKLENLKVGASTLASYEIDNIDIYTLLFQTGYLTIKHRDRQLYTLDYPNREVKESMLEYLIGGFSSRPNSRSTPLAYALEDAFQANDLESVIEVINTLFASIPYQIFQKDSEAFYHALIHLVFTYLGLNISSEVSTSRGRCDAIVQTDTHVYLLEFKLNQSPDAAIQQIKERGYADQFRQSDKELILVGINFSSEKKEVKDWEMEGIIDIY